MLDKKFSFRAIGWVENTMDQRAPTDEFLAVESRLVIDPALIQGLSGLEIGQQIMVLFYLDRSKGYELMQYPRGNRSRPMRGVFALRSPNRPNKIGVTVVELIGINENILHVRGLDALNGTPILDIKPA